MNCSDQLNELALALSRAQGELRDAHKDKRGYSYTYADLGQVLDLVRPIFSKQGLAISQLPGIGHEGTITLETVLMHASGQWISSVMEMPAQAGKGMSSAQAVGSALTYCRRYALAAVVGITQTDDDGASVAPPEAITAQPPARTKPATKPAASGPRVTQEQAEEIGALVMDTGTHLERFCNFFGIETFAELSAADYKRAKAMLEAKINAA